MPFLHLPLISACRGQAEEACCHLKASLLSEAGDAHLGGIQTSPSLQWLSCILVCILNTPSIPDFTWLKLGADKKTLAAQADWERCREGWAGQQAYPEAVCIYRQGKCLRPSLQHGARPAEWLRWPRREF